MLLHAASRGRLAEHVSLRVPGGRGLCHHMSSAQLVSASPASQTTGDPCTVRGVSALNLYSTLDVTDFVRNAIYLSYLRPEMFLLLP